jgi:hypothetical protein
MGGGPVGRLDKRSRHPEIPPRRASVSHAAASLILTRFAC